MVDQGEVRAGLTVLLHDLEELNDHLRHGAHQNLALAPLLGVVHGLREVGFRVSENPKKMPENALRTGHGRCLLVEIERMRTLRVSLSTLMRTIVSN